MKTSSIRHCHTSIPSMGAAQTHLSFWGPAVVNKEEDSCNSDSGTNDPEADLRLSPQKQKGVLFIRCAPMEDDMWASLGSTIYRRDPSTTGGGGARTVFARFHPTDDDLRFFKAGRARLVYDQNKEKFVPEYPDSSCCTDSFAHTSRDIDEVPSELVGLKCEAACVTRCSKLSHFLPEPTLQNQSHECTSSSNLKRISRVCNDSGSPTEVGSAIKNLLFNEDDECFANCQPERSPVFGLGEEVKRNLPPPQPIITFAAHTSSVYFDLGNDCAHLCSLSEWSSQSTGVFSKH